MDTGQPGHSYLRTTRALLSTSSGAASPVPDVAAIPSSRGRLVEPLVPPSRRAAARSSPRPASLPSTASRHLLADAGALRRLVGEIRELKPLKLSDM